MYHFIPFGLLSFFTVMEQREAGGGQLDQLFEALSHPYRRRILSLVAESNPCDEVEFAPEDLALDSDDTELTTLALYHSHLPKLDAAGFIEWDRDTHVIQRGPRFDEVAPHIRLMRDHRDELPGGWP